MLLDAVKWFFSRCSRNGTPFPISMSAAISVGKAADDLAASNAVLAAPDINAELFREPILPGLAKLQGDAPDPSTPPVQSWRFARPRSSKITKIRKASETIGAVLTSADLKTIDASISGCTRRMSRLSL